MQVLSGTRRLTIPHLNQKDESRDERSLKNADHSISYANMTVQPMNFPTGEGLAVDLNAS